MNTEDLKDRLAKIVDEWAAQYGKGSIAEEKSIELKKELPKDKRLVVTKSSGDRKYQLDEIKNTRAWITTPSVLEALGWKMEDAVEIDDAEILKYQLIAPIYKAPDAA